MPPSPFQARVLSVIAGNRSPDSHVAGGVAINLDFERLSDDIDIFHSAKVDLEAVSEADAALLRAADMEVHWTKVFPTFRSAEISGADGRTRLDWAVDSDIRFFPAEQDDRLGWRLHAFDLATNKALAAAARREPRDAVDLLTLHRRVIPLGAVAWAAVAKDPGFSPLSLLDWISRFARYQQSDLDDVEGLSWITAAELSLGLKEALLEAREFVEAMPPDQAGYAYVLDGRPVQPDPSSLDKYERRLASRRGLWPITGELTLDD